MKNGRKAKVVFALQMDALISFSWGGPREVPSEAKVTGDILIVAVNSDDSVKRLNKGPNRPVNDEASRAYLIAALEFVDVVVIFSRIIPKNLINEIIPDVLVKGGDYEPSVEDRNHPKYIVGRDVALKNGGSGEDN